MSEFTQGMEIVIKPTLGPDDADADSGLPEVLAKAIEAADGDVNGLADWYEDQDEEGKIAFMSAVLDMCESGDTGPDIEAWKKRTGFHA